MASNFEKVMQACLESKKTPAKKTVNNKKTVKKSINESKKVATKKKLREELEEDEVDVDVEDDVDVDDDGVMDDVVDDVVVVVDPELDAEEAGDMADELQDIIDDTPKGEVPATDEYIGDFTYGCPICGSNFFSDTEMHAGDECPVCGETPDDFVLVGQIAEEGEVAGDEESDLEDDFADEEIGGEEDLDVETPDEDLEADVDEEEFESFRRKKRVENRNKKSVRKNTGYSLDESTFNPFMTKFIRENYKNAKSFVMKRATYNKATKDLRVECLVTMKSGKTKKATLKFERFNPNNKVLSAKDASRTFKCESKNVAPFRFKVSCVNKVIKCEGLRYNYTTKNLKENVRLQVSGNLIKESRKNPTRGRRVK